MNTNNAYSQILSVLENSELHSGQPEPLPSEPLNSAASPNPTSSSLASSNIATASETLGGATSAGSTPAGSASAGSASADSASADSSASPANAFGLNDEGAAAGIDLFALLEMASDLLGGNDKETKEKLALLSALTPFINPENTDKLEIAKKVIKISGLAKQFTKKN